MADSPYAKAWVFSNDDPALVDGETFTGAFTGRIDVGQTKRYGEAPVAIFVEEETGEERGIWLFSSVLKNALTKAKPQEGERVVISFLGKKKGSGDFKYNNFAVELPDRPKVTLSWSDFEDPEEEDAA